MNSAIGRVAEALKGSVGKTQGEMALAMVQAVFPPDHVEVRFAQWMVDNAGRIREACMELGIEAPDPGPGLYERLKAAVTAVLEEQ